MLIFHEGLPGSGKTYEAMSKHILPAVEKGRRVYAHIDGLDDPDYLGAIADCLALPISTVQDRISYLDKSQVLEIWNHVEPNSLVVIDEIQDYFPVDRQRPRPELSEWVSRHRHDGIDILALGQNLKDVHNIWKRRVDRKVVFHKLDALGAVNRYRWVAMKCVGEMRFEKTVEGIESYQQRFFGTYKSHHSEEVSTAHYSDRRAVVWNSPMMRFVIVFVVTGAILIPWYLSRQFSAETSDLVHISESESRPGGHPVSSPVATSHPVPTSAPVAIPVAPAPVPQSPVSSSSRSYGDDYADHLATSYRIRLSSVLLSANKTYVVLEYRDEAMRIQDRLDQYALLHLGWTIEVISLQMVKLRKAGRVLVATSWPLQALGEVSDEHNRQVSEQPVKKS